MIEMKFTERELLVIKTALERECAAYILPHMWHQWHERSTLKDKIERALLSI